MDDEISFDQLVDKYHIIGEEGHHLEPYRELLEDAKRQGVHLHAGFLPRKYARMLMRDGEEPALEAQAEEVLARTLPEPMRPSQEEVDKHCACGHVAFSAGAICA